MSHLEGVLTLVSDSGPWFRVQGRHVRPVGASRVGVRLSVDPHSGLTVDVHLGLGLWIRAGWFPTHSHCRVLGPVEDHMASSHRCWGRWLTPRVMTHGLA